MKNISMALALIAGLMAPMAFAADNTSSTTGTPGGMGCCQNCCCMK